MSLFNSYSSDIGTVVSLNTGSVISGASSYSISVKKPDGTTTTWSAILDTTDTTNQSLAHTVIAGDITIGGMYVLQAVVNFSSGAVFYGQSVVYRVNVAYS